MKRLSLFFYKLSHWEYWPMSVIYFPIMPVWFYLAFKSRSFFFFNAANPQITNGGMAMESKMEIYDTIPKKHFPKTLFVKKDTDEKQILKALNRSSIKYPLIAKPDVGLKALGVEKIENEVQLLKYALKLNKDFLIQELIEFSMEIGVFYIRKPNEKNGRVTGIVSKEFLKVTGDGISSIEDLIKTNPRSHFQIDSLRKKYGAYLTTILPLNEDFILVPYGSHTRGAKFIDDSDKINESMQKVIDDICLQVPQLYYGRLDIRCESLDDLSNGKNFSIIEINGAGSEPTHIYDPKHSIFFAWKEIIKYWKVMHHISMMNHKKGAAFLTYKQGTTMLSDNKQLEQYLKTI